jgi:ATP-dependent DNA helicase DinG
VLHSARRAASGSTAYDDRVVRARLGQAFGRLIRRRQDRGIFILLSAATPSRLLNAFPPGVPIRRLPLDQAIEAVRSTLSLGPSIGHAEADKVSPEGSR